MNPVEPVELPATALLRRYGADGEHRGYADAYRTEVAGVLTLADFVQAFYNSRAFQPERWVLHHLARRPSTRDDVHALAAGRTDRFAAWSVEARTAHELLLADDTGRTRSWLMVAPATTGTALHFGSAVVPRVDRRTGERRMGPLFGALLGFHKAYSRVLLRSAARTLANDPPRTVA